MGGASPQEPFDSQHLIPTAKLNRRRTERGSASPGDDVADTNACVTINGGYSVTGARSKNDDSYLIDAERHLWAVSDGIGGAPFGEVISRVSCNYLAKAWDAATPLHPQIADRLTTAIRLVDTYVSELSDLLGRKGSGATLTVAHYDGRTLTIASVGDSRAYLLRSGSLEQVSNDGRVSETSNALDQALGYHLALRPTIASFTPRPGDVLAICTDGVWATQSLDSMRTALSQGVDSTAQMAAEGNPQHMAYRLAQGADMSDNATAVVVLFNATGDFPLLTPSI